MSEEDDLSPFDQFGKLDQVKNKQIGEISRCLREQYELKTALKQLQKKLDQQKQELSISDESLASLKDWVIAEAKAGIKPTNFSE